MPRPRGYARQDVVKDAKETFWENGYEGTVLPELERRTGLNRSSLYLAFGSKRELFTEALDLYVEEVVDPLLDPLGSGLHGLDAVTTFLSGVKTIILDQQRDGRRGCLMVNTIAELSTRDEDAASRAASFRERLRGAFTRALTRAAKAGEIDRASIPRRAGMLTVATFGVWISARIDLRDAANLCDEITAEVQAWRSPVGDIS
jgi:TetR/AcrR family transcriptional regulator, transcriptional repressor for nem operon